MDAFARQPALEILPEQRGALRKARDFMASMTIGENAKFTWNAVSVLVGLAIATTLQVSAVTDIREQQTKDAAAAEKRFDKIDANIGAQAARIDGLILSVVPRGQVEDIARSIAREELLRASK